MKFKRKPIVAAVVSILVLAGIIAFAIVPLLSQIDNAGKGIVEQDARIADYGKRIAELRKFKAFAKQEEQNFNKLDKIFIDGQMPLVFINFLENNAKLAKVKISFLPAASQNKGDDKWGSINLQANLKGKMTAIMEFLTKIERGPYALEVLSFRLEADDLENDDIAAIATTTEAISREKTGSAVLYLKVYTKAVQ